MKKQFLWLMLMIAWAMDGNSQSVWCQNNAPISGLPDTVLSCSSNSALLTANSGYANYLWNTGSNTQAINASLSGLYWVEITDDSMCVTRDSVLVSSMAINLDFEDTIRCSAGNLLVGFDATAGANLSAAYFNGSNSHTWLAAADFPVGVSNRTIEAWINHPGQVQDAVLFAYGNLAGGSGFECWLGNDDSLKLIANSHTYVASGVIPANGWHHFSVSIDQSGKYSFEIDFQQVDLGILDASFNTMSADTAWMAGSGASYPFTGYLDEFKVWSSLVSPSNMYLHSYMHAHEFTSESLLVYYDFNSIIGNLANDFKDRPLTSLTMSSVVQVPFPFYTYAVLGLNGWISNQTSLLHYVAESGTLVLSFTDGISVCEKEVDVTVVPDLNFNSMNESCNQPAIFFNPLFQYDTYLWSNGSTASSQSFSQSGEYWLQVQTGTCQSADTFHVELLNITIPQADTTICAGQSVSLQAQSSTGNYFWNTGQVLSSITVNPVSNSWYVCQISSDNLTCSDSVYVEVLPLPELYLQDSVELCNQNTHVLIPSNNSAYSYSWNTGASSSVLIVQNSGYYTVTVQHTNGCEAVDQAWVGFHSVSIPTTDLTTCDGIAIPLECVASEAFIWSTGATTNSINVNPFISTLYWVSLINYPTCSDQVMVHAGGFINSGLPDTLAICGSSSLEIAATAGYASYVWSNGGSLPTNTVSTSGTYFLTIQDAYLCSLEDSVQVSVINATLTASSDTLCEGELVMLTANSGPYDFLWSTGDTDPVIFQNPLVSTDYTVLVDDGISGCYFSISVFVNTVGTGPISGEMEVIAGDSVYLYTVEGLEGSSFEWLVSGGVVDTIIGDSLWVIWLNEGEGFIQLTEFAANGCTGIPVTFSIDVLDLEEFDKPLIRIYPNPFASKITLEGLKGQEQIELYNVAGQLVLKRIANAPHLQIDATTLPDGVYFLQVQDSGNSTIHSLIKQGR